LTSKFKRYQWLIFYRPDLTDTPLSITPTVQHDASEGAVDVIDTSSKTQGKLADDHRFDGN
jgi:hypothetical protein